MSDTVTWIWCHERFRLHKYTHMSRTDSVLSMTHVCVSIRLMCHECVTNTFVTHESYWCRHVSRMCHKHTHESYTHVSRMRHEHTHKSYTHVSQMCHEHRWDAQFVTHIHSFMSHVTIQNEFVCTLPLKRALGWECWAESHWWAWRWCIVRDANTQFVTQTHTSSRKHTVRNANTHFVTQTHSS